MSSKAVLVVEDNEHDREIYGKLLTYRRFPDDLLTGKGDRMEALRSRLSQQHRTF